MNRHYIHIPEFKQLYPASCVIKCEEVILKRFGINVTEDELCGIARHYGWYNPVVGVHYNATPMLLQGFGLSCKMVYEAAFTDLNVYLQQKCQIMAGVCRAKLLGGKYTQIEASHSVLVEAMDDDMVFITDPADGSFFRPVHKAEFLSGWQDSRRFLLVAFMTENL